MVLSLALADWLSGLVPPLLLSTYLAPEGDDWFRICYAKDFIAMLSVLGNILNVLFISVERLIGVHCPLRYTTIVTEKRILISIAFLWMFNLLYIIIPRTLVGTPIALLKPGECTLDKTIYAHRHKMLLATAIVYIILQLAINIHLALMSWKVQKKIRNDNITTDQISGRKSQLRRTKTLLTVFVVYIAFYIPCPIATYLGRQIPEHAQIMLNVTQVVYFISTWINPILYIKKDEYFQKAFKKMILK